MDKKKIIIPLSIAAVLTTSAFINSEKVNAGKGMCTYKAVFFYNEGIDPSHTGIGTTINNTSWTIGSGSSSEEISNATYEARDMTQQDCVNYVNNIGYKSAGSSTSDCREEEDHSITCGNEHINSGSYETGQVATGEMKDMISNLGGGDIEKGCEIFTNNTIKADNIEVIQNGKNKETGKPQDQITRDYDYDTGVAMVNPNGKEFKYSAQTVIKTWTAPCDVEDKEPEKEECTCAGSGGGGGGSSMTTCGGTITNSVTNCESGSFTGTSENTYTCTTNPTITWSVKYTTTETITVSVNIAPNPIYAGGGVGLKINQNSSTSTSIGSICVSTNEKVPECPDGYDLSASSSGFTCSKDTVTEEATCTAVSGPSAADEARAQSLARAAAGKAGGGSTPKDITVSARQSNDEKDKNYYNLNRDEVGQGIAISSIKNSKETTVEEGKDGLESDNTMGTGRVIQSSVNQACINRKTGKVRYITSGDCTDDEVDGGHKYYVPLKEPNGEFIFKLSSDNISSIATSKLNANCVVKVNQKLYGDDGKYKFIYRPVDITKPTDTVFPNRNPATNWVNFKKTSNSSGTGKYDQAMKRDRVEYTAKLDTAGIQNIKNINEEYLGKDSYYNSFNTINNSGASSILSNLGVTRGSLNKYNKLGECNRKVTISVDGELSNNASSIIDGTECW